jgi:hypothetical protein
MIRLGSWGASDQLVTETIYLRQNRIRAILPSIQPTLSGGTGRDGKGGKQGASYNRRGEPKEREDFFV